MYVCSCGAANSQLKTLKTLDCYRTYIANQDEAQKAFNEMKRKHSRFVTFIDVSSALL